MGYAGGNVILPWYMPPAYGEGAGGPRSVKCHSCRLSSDSGAAWKVGFGFFAAADSSCVSFNSRLIVGEGAISRYQENTQTKCKR